MSRFISLSAFNSSPTNIPKGPIAKVKQQQRATCAFIDRKGPSGSSFSERAFQKASTEQPRKAQKKRNKTSLRLEQHHLVLTP